MFSWLSLRKRKPAPLPAIPEAGPHHVKAQEPTTPEPANRHPEAQEPAATHPAIPEPATRHLGAQEPTAPEPAPQETASQQPPADHTAQRTRLEALIARASFPEAEASLAALPATLAGQEWYLRAAIILARRRGDHAQTLAYATQLQAAAPTTPIGFGAASHALRALKRPAEASQVAQAGLQRFPNAAGLLLEAALAAEAAGDTDRAYANWAGLRAAQPKTTEGYIGAIQLSIRKQQPDTTRTLIEQGTAAFPTDRKLRLAAARNAVRCQMWADAATHWAALTSTFPDDHPLALEAAMSLIGTRRGRRSRMAAVFAQLAALRKRAPDFAPAYAGTIRALRETGRLDEAALKGEAWRVQFPDNQDLAIACARVAEDQGRHADALAILEATRPHAKTTPHFEVAYLRSLSLAGQHDAAEVATDAALARFPQDMRVIEQHVALATRRGDFADAAARAARLAACFPDNADIAKLGRKLQALQHEPGHHTAPPASNQDSLAAFFTGFESLGATSSGCEFGLVQRRFGAEPLGLLRWGNISIAGLTSGLRNRFAGLGEPENTRIVVQRASANHKEYFLYDDRYTYWTHTFINAEDAPADRVLKQSLRRLTFLRGKLLEDLAQASKIFVFKISRIEEIAALHDLHAALATYGNATLLAVTLADETHKRGTVEMLQPGLFLGRAAMFMDAGSAEERGIDADLWRLLCEQVPAAASACVVL